MTTHPASFPGSFIERIVTVDGTDTACRFFRPVADRGDFHCQYEIAWAENTRSRKIYGVDEVQALLPAMQIAHTDRLLAHKHNDLRVLFLDGQKLGLPIAESMRCGGRNDGLLDGT